MTATNTISNIQGTTAWGFSAIQSHWFGLWLERRCQVYVAAGLALLGLALLGLALLRLPLLRSLAWLSLAGLALFTLLPSLALPRSPVSLT